MMSAIDNGLLITAFILSSLFQANGGDYPHSQGTLNGGDYPHSQGTLSQDILHPRLLIA